MTSWWSAFLFGSAVGVAITYGVSIAAIAIICRTDR